MLCKTFAAQMGGNIIAVNNAQGMTFSICLPAAIQV
jgi:signal transduction histidine kinase